MFAVIDSDTEIPLSSLIFGNIWSIVVIGLEDSRGHSDKSLFFNLLALRFKSLAMILILHHCL